MKVVKIVALLLFAFIAWMNVTPGHFQSEYCGCGVGYYTENDLKQQEKLAHSGYPKTVGEGSFTMTFTEPPCPICAANPSGLFLSLFSLVDFNK